MHTLGRVEVSRRYATCVLHLSPGDGRMWLREKDLFERNTWHVEWFSPFRLVCFRERHAIRCQCSLHNGIDGATCFDVVADFALLGP